jgi:hypothetical protein
MPFQFRKEAIEEDLNSNFPSQGQGNPPLYYSLSEVVVPTYSINSVTEGSGLPENLQTAWDFSTGYAETANTSTTLINNTGFWKVNTVLAIGPNAANGNASLRISDGLSVKEIWAYSFNAVYDNSQVTQENDLIVFLRSGDSLIAITDQAGLVFNNNWRQIADVNGNLVNPLGFSFA